MTLERLEPAAPRAQAKHSTNEPLCSLFLTILQRILEIFSFYCDLTILQRNSRKNTILLSFDNFTKKF